MNRHTTTETRVAYDNSVSDAHERHTKKQSGFWAFSKSAPRLWNSLPVSLRRSGSIFRQLFGNICQLTSFLYLTLITLSPHHWSPPRLPAHTSLSLSLSPLYIFIYTYIYTYIHTYIHARTHALTHARMNERTNERSKTWNNIFLNIRSQSSF